jgi:hypothetical protein
MNSLSSSAPDAAVSADARETPAADDPRAREMLARTCASGASERLDQVPRALAWDDRRERYRTAGRRLLSPGVSERLATRCAGSSRSSIVLA